MTTQPERCRRCDDPVCDVPAAHEACKGINWYTESDDASARHERLGRATRDCLQRHAVDWRARALAAEVRRLRSTPPAAVGLTGEERSTAHEAVARFVDMHAQRIAADAGFEWHDMPDEQRDRLASHVHDVLNNLRWVDGCDGGALLDRRQPPEGCEDAAAPAPGAVLSEEERRALEFAREMADAAAWNDDQRRQVAVIDRLLSQPATPPAGDRVLTVGEALALPLVKAGARWVEWESGKNGPSSAPGLTCQARVHSGDYIWRFREGDHWSRWWDDMLGESDGSAECRLITPPEGKAESLPGEG